MTVLSTGSARETTEMNYILVWYRFNMKQTGFTYQKLIYWFSSGEINILVWMNGIYALLTVIKPTRIWNSLCQSCEVKQRICESENHYMKNHSLHQKVWPSEVTAPDYEFLCLFLTRAKQKKDRGGFGIEKRGGFSGNTLANIIIIPYLYSHI